MNPMSPDEKKMNKQLIDEMRMTFSKFSPLPSKTLGCGERQFLIRPAPF